LLQADGHPGNVLVGKGGRIGLLDYGQSKQLPGDQRKALASLVLALVKWVETTGACIFGCAQWCTLHSLAHAMLKSDPSGGRTIAW